MILDKPDQTKCNQLLQEAAKWGAVKRPDHCEECKQLSARIHGHHNDYTRPLEVEWLCPKCHRGRHAVKRKTKQLNVHIPEELMDKLRNHSFQTDVPQARLVKKALEEFLNIETQLYENSVPPLDPVVDTPEGTKPLSQLYRCPVHHDSLRPSPTGRCFCNRKTSEAV